MPRSLIPCTFIAGSFLLAAATSCNRGPAPVRQPYINASSAGKLAIEQYDKNGDGLISGDELEGAPALKAALPRSADFTFIADGRDKWGLGFLITVDQVPGKRSPGSLSWGGINNTFFWIDPARGIAGVIMMQYLPFADAKALTTYDAFERGAYQLVNAER